MEKNKKNLNFRFHNPNPAGVMEKAIEQLLIDNGIEKLHTEYLNFICNREEDR